MTFNQLANLLEEIEQTNSRLDITRKLAKLLPQLKDEEIRPALYLIQGRLVPRYQSLEFSLSEKMILRALTMLLIRHRVVKTNEASNLFGQLDEQKVLDQVVDWYKQVGDLGVLAESIVSQINQPPSPIPLLTVYNQLVKIALESGDGSQERKLTLLTSLLEKLDPSSAKYLVRIILGKMRLGFGLMTLLDALSWARVGDKSDSSQLEKAYQRKADVGELAYIYLKSGLDGLKQSHDVQVGIPVVPELCQRLNTTDEIITKMGQVVAEPKYDGLRAQLHFDKKQQLAKVFTRNLEDVSHMFPEAKKALTFLTCQNCILDAEAVGVDPTTNTIVPFQETMKRKRKYDIEQLAKELPVKFYVFDILDFNNQPLIDLPLIKRKTYLSKAFKPNKFMVNTPFKLIDDPKKLRQFHQQMLSQGYEGVVTKDPQAKYRAGRKGWRWVKIKEAEGNLGKLNDTLDLVVMGYYLGKGKRSEFGLGAILVGVIDDEKVYSIAKIGTGMTEQQLLEIRDRLSAIKVEQKPKEYQPVDKSLKPDEWVRPELVVEVAADEITRSPVHAAGVALRFPRLVRIRTDKSWTDATNINELKQLQNS